MTPRVDTTADARQAPAPFLLDLAKASWTVSLVGDPPSSIPPTMSGLVDIPATVPGCVHTDLLAADYIADPFLGVNETACAWVSDADWEYRACFDLPQIAHDGRLELHCDGLQTVACLAVNGIPIAATENMHRQYRFDITDQTRPGANELTVRFASSVREMHRRARALGDLPFDWAHPYNQLRIMASSGGWDWGPSLVSAGIWRAITVRERPQDRLDVAVTTSLDADLRTGKVLLRLTLESGAAGDPAGDRDEGTRDVDVRMGKRHWRLQTPLAAATHELEIDLAGSDLWWPRGFGDPVLHDLEVGLVDSPERFTHRIGFRRVVLESEPDEHGRSFRFRVNDRPLFVRGANWIPDDALISRVSPERIRTRIDQAIEANINLLRVWGGGVYEDPSFYRGCDERGVLVWQDFMFACAAYSEEEPLRSEVRAEAEDAVRRLSVHPSVIVWNGSNETILAWHDWGWRSRIGDRTWGDGYYRVLLPSVVERLAPGAIYLASSPISLGEGVHPLAEGDGAVHVWDVWNRLDYGHYRDQIPRFVAEFGFQAPANWSTLAAAIGESNIDSASPILQAHQKQPDGALRLRARLAERFPEPERIEEEPDAWHAATQLNQAHALRVGIEHYRSWWPRTTGSVVWQLNDTWPAMSWSLIDSAGGRKLGWFGVRRAYADRLVSIHPREGGLSAVLVNDTDEPWAEEVCARRIDTTAGERARLHVPVVVPPRSVETVRLGASMTLPRERRDELIVVDAGSALPDGSRRAVHTFLPDDGVRWPVPRLHCAVDRPAPGVTTVRVETETIVTDLSILADRLDVTAVVDSALITLLPGESHLFTIRSEQLLADDRLTTWPVLVTRSHFFHQRSVR